MTHELKTNAAGAVFEPNFPAKPGDTIILPEKFSGIYCVVEGTPDNPITITNGTRTAVGYDGIDLSNSKHVRVVGDSEKPYGIVIDKSLNPNKAWNENTALKITGFVQDIQVSGLYSTGNTYGMVCKNESSCDEKLNAWQIMDITLQNCRFENSFWQHIYAGSTNLNGTKRPTQCNGQWLPIPPPQMGNIIVRNNIFEGSGRAAVQISQAMLGWGAVVENNKISKAGRESDGQGNSLNFGLSKIKVTGNSTNESRVCGLAAYACPEMIIENNDFQKNGWLNGQQVTPWAWGIWIDDDEIDPQHLLHFIIRNNKIGERGNGAGPTLGNWNDIQIGTRYGKPAGKQTYQKGNIISGNTSIAGKAKIFVEAGIDWSEGSAPPPAKKILFTRSITLNKITKKYTIYTDGTWSAQ